MMELGEERSIKAILATMERKRRRRDANKNTSAPTRREPKISASNGEGSTLPAGQKVRCGRREVQDVRDVCHQCEVGEGVQREICRSRLLQGGTTYSDRLNSESAAVTSEHPCNRVDGAPGTH
jgi:hypothetical protein